MGIYTVMGRFRLEGFEVIGDDQIRPLRSSYALWDLRGVRREWMSGKEFYQKRETIATLSVDDPDEHAVHQHLNRYS